MAADILEWRGTTPRSFRNMLVFLAADQRRLDELEQATATYLAWSSIDNEAAELNLDEHQKSQARSKRKAANEAVKLLIDQTYQWVLVPGQPDPKGPLEWQAVKADGPESLAVRASRRLVHEGLLATQFPAVLLRFQLDTVIPSRWEDGHVSVAQLWDDFARYVYLPRLADINVLISAVSEGPASMTWQTEGFATADADDEASGRYQGLSVASHPRSVQSTTLVVRPEVALGHIEAEGASVTIQAHPAVASGVGTAPSARTRARRSSTTSASRSAETADEAGARRGSHLLVAVRRGVGPGVRRGLVRRMNVLVGPNNCGKSNVLRAIALALDPAHPYDPATDLPGTMPLPISS